MSGDRRATAVQRSADRAIPEWTTIGRFGGHATADGKTLCQPTPESSPSSPVLQPTVSTELAESGA
eukprot:scaffold697_cov235-Pinguiococcus_pyrenoidosus.AAC.1